MPTELSALYLINQISAVMHGTKPEYGDGKTPRANGDDDQNTEQCLVPT
jgi:hypothetical protein